MIPPTKYGYAKRGFVEGSVLVNSPLTSNKVHHSSVIHAVIDERGMCTYSIYLCRMSTLDLHLRPLIFRSCSMIGNML